MKKTTKKIKATKPIVEAFEDGTFSETAMIPIFPPIAEITDSFSNGELNMLKDKINELIRRI